MKVAVFGATGPLGLEATKYPLEKGYDVIALVRNADKLHKQIQHERLQVETVNVMDPSSISPHLRGCDAVICCLGATSNDKPMTIMQDGLRSIAAGMKEAGVSRLVSVSSWCSRETPGAPKIIRWFIKPCFLKNILEDLRTAEDHLAQECPEINYTFVKPCILNVAPLKPAAVTAVEGEFVPISGCGFGYPKMPRANVAKFMIDCLDTNDWDKKLVAICLES